MELGKLNKKDFSLNNSVVGLTELKEIRAREKETKNTEKTGYKYKLIHKNNNNKS